MNKAFWTLLVLLIASLLMSTAGISIFLWSLFILFIIDFYKTSQSQGFKPTFRSLKTGVEVPLLFFALWTFISSVVNVGTLSDFLICIWEMRFIVGFYFMAYLFKKYLKDNLKIPFITLGTVVIICGIYGLLQTFFQIDLIRSTNDHLSAFGNFFRATGFFKIPLTYAYIISMLGFFFYGYIITHLQKRDSAFYFSAMAFLCSIIGAGASWTRGAWIGLYAAVMLVTYIHSKKLCLKVFVITTICFFGLLINKDFRHRSLSIVDITDYQSNTDRIDVWKANLAMVSEHPILGVGWNQNHDPELLKKYYSQVGIESAGIYDHAHNDFISILAKLGYPGLLAFLAFIFAFLYKNYSALKSHTSPNIKTALIGALGAQIIFYTGSLTQANFTDMEVLHTLFLIWAMVQSYSSSDVFKKIR